MTTAVERVDSNPSNVDIVGGSDTGKSSNGFLHEVEKVALNVLQGVKIVFTKLGQIRMNVNAFSRLIELGGYGFTVAQLATGNNTGYSAMTNRIIRTKDVIDGIQGLDGISYFGSKDVRKESVFKTLGNGAMLLASAGSVFGIVARIAEKVGSVPILGKIAETGVSFGQMMSGIAGFGYSCFGAEAIERIKSAKTSDEKRQACIDLAWFVSEIAAKVFIVFASAYLGGVIALGAVAATLGIVSYLHATAVKENAAEKKAGGTV